MLGRDTSLIWPVLKLLNNFLLPALISSFILESNSFMNPIFLSISDLAYSHGLPFVRRKAERRESPSNGLALNNIYKNIK